MYNESLWLAEGGCGTYGSLRGDLRVDVAVVGAGITGLTAALLLKRAGKRVAVVEASVVGGGVTGATTAHVTQAVDVGYRELRRAFGADEARLVARSTRGAMDQIEAFVRELGAECALARVPAFLFSEREDDVGDLHEEQEAAACAGVPAVMTRTVPLPFPVAAAVRFEEQAELHPCRYVAALARAVDGDGSVVLEGTHARELVDSAPCRVVTDSGTVTADAIVAATNAPLHRFFVQTKIASYRSYVVAFVPRTPLSPGLYFDTDDPYHYVRAAEIAGVQYAMVGGEDHKTGHVDDTEAPYARLEGWCRARLAFDQVVHRWSAQVIEPVDGLPFIGRTSRRSNVWTSTGYSGTGMTFGTLGGMVLSDAILGRANEWAALYDAHRVHRSGVKEYVAGNAEVAGYLVGDRLRGAEGSSLEDVAPGQGKLLHLDGRRVAVYRDEAGGVHARSPVCPHLGCLVHFNTAEKTWDCPCHGSRFTPDGEVVHGPAMTALRAVTGPSIPMPPRRTRD